MKRTILNISAVFLLFSSLIACKKYLEVNAQSDYVYISSVSDCQALLDDYVIMNTGGPANQIISSDEYYSTDLFLNAAPFEEKANYLWNPEKIVPSTDPAWNRSYQRIAVANLVLDNINKFRDDNNTTELHNAEGGALFHRAYNLWFVAQLFAKPYNKATASQDAGVPIRQSADINEKIFRGTVEKTYRQIISDLQKAAELLPGNATTPSRGSKVAAYSMLARVYLSMGEYAAAQENASLALAINSTLLDFNQLSLSSNTPITRFNKEVVFHTVTTITTILNSGNGSGGFAKFAPDLVASYSPKDLRKQIYFKQNAGTEIGTYRFAGNYEGVTNATFFEGIAIDEVYITRAECYARQGNTAAAMEDLNTLLQTRFINTLASPYTPLFAANPTDALRMILAERKKELIMRGLRWTDLRRLNLDPATAVTLTRVSNGVTYTLPPNDLRYTLMIPFDVIAANNVAQNPL